MNHYLIKKSVILILTQVLLFILISLWANAKSLTTKEDIISEIRQTLNNEMSLWYPLSIDTLYGGFFSDINYKWEVKGKQNKMIVTQARHIWSASNAALFYGDNKQFLDIASHGFQFIKSKMWDHKYGGFYDLVDRMGEPITENGKVIKRAYGNAFAIYGLAEYYRLSGDSSALKLAQETYNWLEKNGYDAEYGGYFQFMDREGEPFKDGYEGIPPKDYNSSIHILEAYTELYKVWHYAELKERLISLLFIIRDTLIADKGYLNLFFTREWNHITYRDSSSDVRNKNYYFDHISFGHDVETAYLMINASEVLGLEDHNTLTLARKMVDHALENGWDYEYGGLYDRGYYSAKENCISIVKETKEWWSQSEALNSFLLMSILFPDEVKYFNKFVEQWNYIKGYILDNNYDGWYWGGIDKEPDNKFNPKGSIWKGNYHTTRSLINCIRLLNKKS